MKKYPWFMRNNCEHYALWFQSHACLPCYRPRPGTPSSSPCVGPVRAEAGASAGLWGLPSLVVPLQGQPEAATEAPCPGLLGPALSFIFPSWNTTLSTGSNSPALVAACDSGHGGGHLGIWQNAAEPQRRASLTSSSRPSTVISSLGSFAPWPGIGDKCWDLCSAQSQGAEHPQEWPSRPSHPWHMVVHTHTHTDAAYADLCLYMDHF